MYYDLSTWKTCAYISKKKNRIFMKKTKKCTVIRKSIAFMLLFQLVFAFIGGETRIVSKKQIVLVSIRVVLKIQNLMN